MANLFAASSTFQSDCKRTLLQVCVSSVSRVEMSWRSFKSLMAADRLTLHSVNAVQQSCTVTWEKEGEEMVSLGWNGGKGRGWNRGGKVNKKSIGIVDILSDALIVF